MNGIISYYDNYDEDSRLSKNNAHKIEFLTTTYFLEKYLHPNSTLLDVAAGTGAYSFYFAEKGHHVDARDITPSHVRKMNCKLSEYNGSIYMTAGQGDARDLSEFDDEHFDMVLCMGPYYHLLDSYDRQKCIDECLRVLKKNGILAIAYINKYAIFTHFAHRNKKYLTSSIMDKVINKGYILSTDEECFWTDAHFTSPTEMADFMATFKVEPLHFIGADGIGLILHDSVNNFSQEEFDTWMDYHLKTCTEPSINGLSIHGLYIGKKK